MFFQELINQIQPLADEGAAVVVHLDHATRVADLVGQVAQFNERTLGAVAQGAVIVDEPTDLGESPDRAFEQIQN